MNLYIGAVLCFIAIFWSIHLEKRDHTNPYDHFLALKAPSSNPLIVDLGYEVYKGYHNQTSKLNIWKGYAYSYPHSSKSLNCSREFAMQHHQKGLSDGKNLKLQQWTGVISCQLKGRLLNVRNLMQLCEFYSTCKSRVETDFAVPLRFLNFSREMRLHFAMKIAYF